MPPHSPRHTADLSPAVDFCYSTVTQGLKRHASVLKIWSCAKHFSIQKHIILGNLQEDGPWGGHPVGRIIYLHVHKMCANGCQNIPSPFFFSSILAEEKACSLQPVGENTPEMKKECVLFVESHRCTPLSLSKRGGYNNASVLQRAHHAACSFDYLFFFIINCTWLVH